MAEKAVKELSGVVTAVTLPPNRDNAKLMGKSLNCERCTGKTDILYAIEMSDELVCGLCKSEVAEIEELKQRYQVTGC
jgi:BarA-like signal transduction histidine kinase